MYGKVNSVTLTLILAEFYKVCYDQGLLNFELNKEGGDTPDSGQGMVGVDFNPEK